MSDSESHTKIQTYRLFLGKYLENNGIPFSVLCICFTHLKLYDIIQKYPSQLI